MIGLFFGVGMGVFGLGILVVFVGGFIKNFWKLVVFIVEGKKVVFWMLGWIFCY